MKKLFMLLFVVTSLCVCLISCTTKGGKPSVKGTYDDMYAEAVSGVNYVSEYKEAFSPMKRLSNKLPQSFDPSEVVAKVNSYAQANVQAKEVTSDLPEYNTSVEITSLGKSYKMYYNPDDMKTTTEEKIEDDETEVETKTFFTGIVKYEDVTYRFKAIATKEVETEDGEEEVELKFDMYIYFDDTNNKYILIEQEKEVEANESEEKFKYSMCENGKETELFEIEISVENGKTEIELFEKGVKYEVEFYTKKGVQYVEIEVDGAKGTYKIDVLEDGTTNYTLVD